MFVGLSTSPLTKSQIRCHFCKLLCINNKLFVESALGLMRRLAPPKSATMQIGVVDGNYFPWEWRLLPFTSLPIPVPTIDSMFVPLPWDFRGIPTPMGSPFPRSRVVNGDASLCCVDVIHSTIIDVCTCVVDCVWSTVCGPVMSDGALNSLSAVTVHRNVFIMYQLTLLCLLSC